MYFKKEEEISGKREEKKKGGKIDGVKRGIWDGGGRFPLLFNVFGLGITNFDLLGNYGKIKWLRSYVIILFVNLVFGRQLYYLKTTLKLLC